MSNIFTFFKVSLPFSSGDVSAAISSFLQTTTARWGRGNFQSITPEDGSDPYVTRQMQNTCDRGGR